MQSSVSSIDRNVEMTNVWLNEVSDQLNQIDKDEAWACMNAVLHTVRDRVPVNEAAHFAAQLPTLIRGSYYEGWQPSKTPQKWRQKDEYLEAIKERMPGRENINAEETARAVLKVISRHVNPDEIDKLKFMHPEEVRDLWPH